MILLCEEIPQKLNKHFSNLLQQSNNLRNNFIQPSLTMEFVSWILSIILTLFIIFSYLIYSSLRFGYIIGFIH